VAGNILVRTCSTKGSGHMRISRQEKNSSSSNRGVGLKDKATKPPALDVDDLQGVVMLSLEEMGGPHFSPLEFCNDLSVILMRSRLSKEL